jgi:hypothetical protein
MVGNLNVRDQQIKQFTLRGLPHHLFVQQLSAAASQFLNYPLPVGQVVPKPSGVEQSQFVFIVPC